MKFEKFYKPSEVADFIGWVYYDWAFTNRFGIKEKGIRILGFTFTNYIEGEDDFIKFTPEVCARMWRRVKLDAICKDKYRDYMSSINILN